MVKDGVLCCIVVFFFKQKTAYEVRISDWSSDVCSSDLPAESLADRRESAGRPDWAAPKPCCRLPEPAVQLGWRPESPGSWSGCQPRPAAHWPSQRDRSELPAGPDRADERRVGKESGRTDGSRWLPGQEKTKQIYK